MEQQLPLEPHFLNHERGSQVTGFGNMNIDDPNFAPSLQEMNMDYHQINLADQGQFGSNDVSMNEKLILNQQNPNFRSNESGPPVRDSIEYQRRRGKSARSDFNLKKKGIKRNNNIVGRSQNNSQVCHRGMLNQSVGVGKVESMIHYHNERFN